MAVASSGKGELPVPCLCGHRGDFVPRQRPWGLQSTAASRRCSALCRGCALAGVGTADAGEGLCMGRTGTGSSRCWLGTKPTADCAASAKKRVGNSQGKRGKLGGRRAQLESKHMVKHLSDYLHKGKKDFLLSF